MIRKSTQQLLVRQLGVAQWSKTPVLGGATAAVQNRSFFQSITGGTTQTTTTTPPTATTATSSTKTSSTFVGDKKSSFATKTSTSRDVNKSDLAREVAETHDLTIAQSERIINTIFDTIVEVSSAS